MRTTKRGIRAVRGAELHKRSAEASGFDGAARVGRTGRREDAPGRR